MRTRTIVKWMTPALMILAVLVSGSCENTDPIAPDGATMSLTASPNPIDLLVGNSTTITARIFSSAGVPVPDGTVIFFDSTVGQLSSLDATTQDGAATVTLTVSATGSATVNATSGKSKGSLQIQITSGTPAIHLLDASPPPPTVELSCLDPVTLAGSVKDASNNPLPNLAVTFAITSSTVDGTSASLLGFFSPNQAVTDSSGSYTVNFTYDLTSCQNNCAGKSCIITVKGTAASKDSAPLQITETVQ